MPPHARRRPRIAVGGIAHETNTFASSPTTLADFRERALLTGDALLVNARGTDGALGGLIAAAAGRAELLPTLFASATPAGMVAPAAFSTLREGLLARLSAHARRYPGIDGVVLVLHGAMVVDGLADAEGALLREVREIAGPRCPVVAVIDFHANLSPPMVDAADLLIPYRTYPHVDTFARGEDALGLCLRLIAGTMHPHTAWRSLPLLSPLPAQTTTGNGAFASLAAHAAGLAAQPGVLGVSLLPGFPYSDVPEAGASVLVTTDNDQDLAGAIADDLAARWWAQRAAMRTAGVPPAALDPALLRPAHEGPIVLADIADNPGAGAPGDGTALLRHVLDHGYTGVALATLPDPAAVAACHAAGSGATLRLAIGGTRSPWSGAPVDGEWTVRHLGSGVFTNHGPMGAGGTTRLGRTATVERDGVAVILCERRVQTLEPAVFAACGIDPRQMSALIVKSSVHYRAAFGAIARAMIDVEAPGLSTSHLDTLPYRHAPLREAAARV
ncbi:MAG TPA: M81 family metallopeptidase [Thermomicrobiales bacterium]|nr:M81 family metallopeptidase [Thermomicrobiales bacterium]